MASKVSERKTLAPEPHHDEIHSPVSKQVLKEIIEEFWSHRPHLMWGEMFKTPDVNLYRKEGNLVLEVGLPGFDSDELEVVVTDTQVTIKAEREEKERHWDTHYYISEIDHSKFYRSLDLPVEVKSAKSQAVYKEGLLRVEMPLGNPELHRPVFVKVNPG